MQDCVLGQIRHVGLNRLPPLNTNFGAAVGSDNASHGRSNRLQLPGTAKQLIASVIYNLANLLHVVGGQDFVAMPKVRGKARFLNLSLQLPFAGAPFTP